jgi:hypothetical protein
MTNKLETPSVRNCHYVWFSTRERTNEWERGRDDAQKKEVKHG